MTKPTLSTPAARIEARDLATSYWHEFADDAHVHGLDNSTETRLEYVARSLRLDYDAKVADGNVEVTGSCGHTLVLSYDLGTDGFEYPTSGDDAVAMQEGRGDETDGDETRSAVEDGCLTPPSGLSRNARRALAKWGRDACRKAWHHNVLLGEGPTVCSIESGIPVRSVASAIAAWAEVWASLFPATETETATCDGCEKAFPVDEVEVCGNADHGPFGFCRKCREDDRGQPAPAPAAPTCDLCGQRGPLKAVGDCGGGTIDWCETCRSDAEAEPAEATFGTDGVEAFIAGYLDAMWWVSRPELTESGDDERSLDQRGFLVADLTEAAKNAIRRECIAFMETYSADLSEALRLGRGTLQSAGMDFYLSREGHGAGFFDRGPDPVWRRLQQAAKTYGSVTVSLDASGKVEVA